MASPSSTSAYLMNASQWDDECEDYLRHVLVYGAGQRGGGTPSAFPSTIFELTWSLSTLLEGGFDLASLAPFHTAKAAQYLSEQLAAGKGAVGFAPGLGADADDTAKALLILNLLNRQSSLDPMLEHFESDKYFKTYPLERDPSFSANCNVLAALLHAPDPAKYSVQIEKVVRFLLSIYDEQGLSIRDKWNISPFYSLMLLAQAGNRILQLFRNHGLSSLPGEILHTKIPQLLADIARFTAKSQNSDGSWGALGSAEQTAYALLILTATAPSLPAFRTCVENGRHFLHVTQEKCAEYLWVEKVTYKSEILLESYVLAAMKATSGLDIVHQSTVSDATEETRADAEGVQLSADNPTGNDGHDSGIGSPQKSPTLSGETSHDHDLGFDVGNGDTLAAVRSHDQIPESEINNREQHETTHAWTPQNERILLGPYAYLEKHPGKDMRRQFINAFNVWLQVPHDQLSIIETVVRMLHTASLLVDDIEDNSDLRRGRPVAHSIFGTAQTFNSGNYVYFLALDEVRKLGPRAMDIYTEELINLHRGQGMDLYWRETLRSPTEAEYLEMVRNKTGGLFRLAIRLMQSESTTGRDFVPLVDVLGLQFQICDDYLNLKSTTYTRNKGLCEDLTEGKFSFPIIHSLLSDPCSLELLNILKQKPREAHIKEYAVAYMEGTGTFTYTRGVVKGLSAKAMALLDDYEARGWGSGVAVRELLACMSLE